MRELKVRICSVEDMLGDLVVAVVAGDRESKLQSKMHCEQIEVLPSWYFVVQILENLRFLLWSD